MASTTGVSEGNHWNISRQVGCRGVSARVPQHQVRAIAGDVGESGADDFRAAPQQVLHRIGQAIPAEAVIRPGEPSDGEAGMSVVVDRSRGAAETDCETSTFFTQSNSSPLEFH